MSNIKTEIIDAVNEIGRVVYNEMFKPKGFDIGNVVFFVHRHRGAYGYCYKTPNWKVANVEAREIAVTPDCINSGINGIIDTLAHELVHASNKVDGIKDVGGRRHNMKFKARCDAVGLPAEKHSTLGWVTYSDLWREEDMANIISKIPPIAFSAISEVSENTSVPEKKPRNKNLSVHQCPSCGVKARAKPSANIICGDCMEPMEMGE